MLSAFSARSIGCHTIEGIRHGLHGLYGRPNKWVTECIEKVVVGLPECLFIEAEVSLLQFGLLLLYAAHLAAQRRITEHLLAVLQEESDDAAHGLRGEQPVELSHLLGWRIVPV